MRMVYSNFWESLNFPHVKHTKRKGLFIQDYTTNSFGQRFKVSKSKQNYDSTLHIPI